VGVRVGDQRPEISSQTLSVSVLLSAISQRVRVGGAVVGGVWISHATRRRHSCGIRDRLSCGRADCASGFVGNLACNWHGNSVVDVVTAAGAEPGSAAALGGGVGDTGEGAREGIPNDRAADLAWPGVCHHYSTGVFCTRKGRCLAVSRRDFESGLKGDVVSIGGFVVCQVGIADPAGRSYTRSLVKTSSWRPSTKTAFSLSGSRVARSALFNSSSGIRA